MLVENKLEELSEKVELVSVKDLINEYSILKDLKYFSSDMLQNLFKYIYGNLKQRQN